VIQTGGFGQFCGYEATDADTDDGRGDARDGREKAPGEEGEDDGNGEPREDRAPEDRRSRS